MSTLSQLRDRLSSTWENVAEGWYQLRKRASHALTRFNPIRKSGSGTEVETAQEQDMLRASRWGLLAADVWMSDDEVIASLEVPGMDKDDFNITVVDGHLVVRGSKQLQREHKKGTYYSIECAYGEFERAIPLPVEVDEQGATATYRKGILSIRLPKHSKHLSRHIKVDIGK
ncbi:MAG: Hsp20/alpha crystallin family protein [Gammaproteobacteria bacterium]